MKNQKFIVAILIAHHKKVMCAYSPPSSLSIETVDKTRGQKKGETCWKFGLNENNKHSKS